jgi:hypothetical protein
LDIRINNPSKRPSDARKKKDSGERHISLLSQKTGSRFPEKKTRTKTAPKGVFCYRVHAQANFDMDKIWVRESVGRFEIEKGQLTDF